MKQAALVNYKAIKMPFDLKYPVVIRIRLPSGTCRIGIVFSKLCLHQAVKLRSGSAAHLFETACDMTVKCRAGIRNPMQMKHDGQIVRVIPIIVRNALSLAHLRRR